MPAQDDHSALKRQQIIQGAEAVFTDRGYEGASMSQIALRAAVSKGTLYNYFTSKSELFAAFVSEKASSNLEDMFEPEDGDDVGHILRELLRRAIATILAPGSLTLYRIVVSEAAKFPYLAQIYWDTGPQRALVQMTDLLVRQMQAGRLRQADPDVAAAQLFALCHTPACMKHRLRLLHEIDHGGVALIVDEAVRMFLDSYGTVDAAKPLAATAPGG